MALRSAQAASDDEVLAQLRAEIVERLRHGVTTRDALPWYARGLGVPWAGYRAYLVTRYKLSPGAMPENELSDGQLEEERERRAEAVMAERTVLAAHLFTADVRSGAPPSAPLFLSTTP